MRSIPLAQKQRQDSKSQNPVIKVMRKASEAALDDTYEDITHLVSGADVQLNGEGSPNIAVLKVGSTKGAYDIFNVKSATRTYFKKGVKIQVYAGYRTADQILFTGYVVRFFEHDYEKGSKEAVSIKLGDRGFGDGKIDYQKKITTREYYVKEAGDPGYGEEPAGNTAEFWTIKEIIEDILVRYGGMDIGDIFVDSALDESLLGNYTKLDKPYRGSVQFIEESIWDILQLCCEVRRHVGYFDENGHFRTKPLQFIVPDMTEGTAVSGTFTKEIDHYMDDDDVQAQMTVIGGVKFAGRRAEKTIVIDVNPWWGAYGKKSDFENDTGGDGNDLWLDCLYGDPTVPPANKYYGVGFQGTIVPYDGDGIVSPPYTDWPHSAPNRADHATWRLVVAGPFKFTLDGIPNEPYQDPKTGIGEDADMGATGFFTKYNTDGGTAVTINPSTLGYTDEAGADGSGRQWPDAIRDMVTPNLYRIPWGDWTVPRYLNYEEPSKVMSINEGILPSREEWKELWRREYHANGYPPDFPYPEAVIVASNCPGYDGPETDEYFIFCATHLDFVKFYWAVYYKYQDFEQWRWKNMIAWFEKVFRWGKTYAADWTELPVEHFIGTHLDPELEDYYGTNRYDELENPLIFTDAECELLGSMTIDRLRKFHGQARFERPLNLELEIGDLIEVYNERMACTELVSISRLDYSFKKSSSGFNIKMRGGIIEIEGQEVNAWDEE